MSSYWPAGMTAEDYTDPWDCENCGITQHDEARPCSTNGTVCADCREAGAVHPCRDICCNEEA